MAWITHQQVGALLQTDLRDDPHIAALVDHAQALAEIEVGTQASPGAGLQAVLAQIVARMWQAGQQAQVNPAALQQETTGPFGFQSMHPGAAGLGLTNRERGDLRRAAGLSPFWVQPTSRGDQLETAPSADQGDMADGLDPIETLAAAQANVHSPRSW